MQLLALTQPSSSSVGSLKGVLFLGKALRRVGQADCCPGMEHPPHVLLCPCMSEHESLP